MIDESMDAETARTESTYLKQAILDGYAREQWVEDKHYLTSADTQGFVTTADTQNFITSADTEDFATTAYTHSAISAAIEAETARTEATYAKNDALSGFVDENTFYDAIEQLTGFTESTYAKQSALSGLATETWVQEQGYVDSDDVIHIKEISQSDYDDLVSGGTVNLFTLYLIP